MEIVNQPARFKSDESRRLDDGSLLGERGKREEDSDGDPAAAVVAVRLRRQLRTRLETGCGKVDGEGPEGQSGGEDVGVRQRALREPDGVDGCQQGEADGSGS